MDSSGSTSSDGRTGPPAIRQEGFVGSRAGLAAAFVTILIWSSSYSVARVGVRHFDPVAFSALRTVVAAGFLLLIAVPLRVGLPERGDRWRLFSAGFVGVTVYLSLLNTGLEVVESASAAVLIALAPIFVALLSMRFIGERLTRWGWIGLGGAFLGVVLVALGQGSGIRFGVSALLIVLAAIAHAAYNVMTKPVASRYHPVQVVSWVFWSAALAFVPFLIRSRVELFTASAEVYFSAVYLGLFASALGFILWTYALSGAPVSVVASALYTTPPLSALIGWAWLDERPSLAVLVGGAVILAAVVLVIRRGVAPVGSHA